MPGRLNHERGSRAPRRSYQYPNGRERQSTVSLDVVVVGRRRRLFVLSLRRIAAVADTVSVPDCAYILIIHTYGFSYDDRVDRYHDQVSHYARFSYKHAVCARIGSNLHH